MRTPVLAVTVLLCGCEIAPEITAMEARDTVELNIEGHVLEVEVAADVRRRAQGLQHRKHLAENTGMLFVFERSHRIRMWMRNTWIPLSVAFIDERGIIVDIRDMEPLDETIYRAEKPALYSLEVRSGWFRKQRIELGARVRFHWRDGPPRWLR